MLHHLQCQSWFLILKRKQQTLLYISALADCDEIGKLCKLNYKGLYYENHYEC
jgi:hypothetical protein